MKKNLKILVVGCGSIGRRHINNLKSLGIRDFILCDTNEEVLKKASAGLDNPTLVRNFKEALKTSPDAAVICTPSSMHLDMSIELAGKGVHLLIEKPLSDTLDGVGVLEKLVEEKGIVAMMAMCYRFHPVLLRLKQLIDSGAIGRVYHVNYFGGQYLPDWHPNADYRVEYAARKALGGGVVLTTIHGLDDLRWLFGEAEEVRAFIDKVSGLEMDVEDLVVAILRMTNGVYAVWQTDFLQRSKQHRMIITGEEGTLRCDIAGGGIDKFNIRTGRWETETVPFDVNAMYVEESRHFLECVGKGRKPLIDVKEGYRTLKLAIAIKESGNMDKTKEAAGYA